MLVLVPLPSTAAMRSSIALSSPFPVPNLPEPNLATVR